MEKKKIHFILPSGGVKGCFQAGFIYCLFQYFSEYFELYQVDGCSVGSMNGMVIINDPTKLKSFWYSIKTKEDLFAPIEKTKLFGGLLWMYRGFYKKGFYNSEKLQRKVDLFDREKTMFPLCKFNCAVTNITKGSIEYINGENKQLEKYAMASSSPWIMCPPVEIDENYYTDGGLLESYPVKYVSDSDADLKVIFYDETHFEREGLDGENLIYFMKGLIDICRVNNINTWNMKQILKYKSVCEDICIIENKVVEDPMEFSEEIIKKGFSKGEKCALMFAMKHFKLNPKNYPDILM